jgi:hypothetical protein
LRRTRPARNGDFRPGLQGFASRKGRQGREEEFSQDFPKNFALFAALA